MWKSHVVPLVSLLSTSRVYHTLTNPRLKRLNTPLKKLSGIRVLTLALFFCWNRGKMLHPEKGFKELACTGREAWVNTLSKSLLLFLLWRCQGCAIHIRHTIQIQVQGDSPAHIVYLRDEFNPNTGTMVLLRCIQKTCTSTFCVLCLIINEPVLSVLFSPIFPQV